VSFILSALTTFRANNFELQHVPSHRHRFGGLSFVQGSLKSDEHRKTLNVHCLSDSWYSLSVSESVILIDYEFSCFNHSGYDLAIYLFYSAFGKLNLEPVKMYSELVFYFTLS
jgi:thiamine kinase-like enzyme